MAFNLSGKIPRCLLRMVDRRKGFLTILITITMYPWRMDAADLFRHQLFGLGVD